MSLHESAEMYLETVYQLSLQRGNIRSIDLAEAMGYSKPSISRAVGLLKKDGYLTVDEDGFLILTEAGTRIAEKIYERHTVLSTVLTMLGVDEKTAADDACRIEHVISDETFNAIKAHIEQYQ